MNLMKYCVFKDTNTCIRIERVGFFLLFWCLFVTNNCFAFLKKKVVIIWVAVEKNKVLDSLNNKKTMLLSSLCQYWLPLVVGHSYLPKCTVIFIFFLPVFQIPCYVTQAFSRQKKGPLILGTHSLSLKKGKEKKCIYIWNANKHAYKNIFTFC